MDGNAGSPSVGAPVLSDPDHMVIEPQSQKRTRNSDDIDEEVLTPPHNPKNPKTLNDTCSQTASIQNVYSHPDLTPGLRSYSSEDLGPFIVHITRDESSPSDGTSIRPIKIGQILIKSGVQDILLDGIKKVGRNRVSVEFRAASSANLFLKNEILLKNNLTGSIPTYNFSRMGLVRGIPADMSMDEFVESVELPRYCGKILKARRLSRKSREEDKISWIPTNTVVITFQGQRLPENIFSYKSSLPVEKYQLPSIQCVKCCRFGHIQVQYRSNPRCYRCAQPHTGDSCTVAEDSSTCLFCSSNHFATNKNCPEHSRQKNIKSVMSEENISYQEASLRFGNVRKSYADAVSTPSQYVDLTQNSIPPNSYIQTPSSYKRTYIRTPRPRPPLGKAYDRKAHNTIISSPRSEAPNGCAINNHTSENVISSQGISPNENLIEIIISLLLNIVSKYNDAVPTNVAQQVMSVLSTISNGPDTTDPME